MIDSIPPFVPLDSMPGTLGEVTRADVIAEARTWLDTPYVHQHRAKGVGVDCLGLVIGICRELGLKETDFDVNGYERRPDGTSFLANCDRHMDRIPMRDLRPGNVLAFAFETDPTHLGIVGDYLYGGMSLIHALGTSDGRGRVVEWQLTRRKGWKPVQAYALRGVA